MRFLLLFVSLLAFGGEDDAPVVYFRSGPNQGQRIDNKNMRALRPVSAEQDKQFRKSPSDQIVADFRHEGKYWIARIPESTPEDVILQQVIYQTYRSTQIPTDAHIQMRFKLKPGSEIELFPLSGGNSDKPEKTVGDVVFTTDGNGPWDGTPYHRLRTVGLQMANIRQAMSTQDAWVKDVGATNQQVRQYRIKLDPDGKKTTWNEAIKLSRDKGYTELFNILNQDCSSAAMEILNPVSRHIPRFPGANFFEALPQIPLRLLKLRGLFTEDKLPTLNQELLHLGNDPVVAEHIRAKQMDLVALQKIYRKDPVGLGDVCRVILAFTGIY